MENHELIDSKDLNSLRESNIPAIKGAAGGKAIFDNSLLSILISNPKGEIIKANKAATRLFGYSFEEFLMLGRNVLMETDPAVMDLVLDEIKETGFTKGEMTGVKKNGDHFLMEYSSALLLDLNGEAFCYTIINDISGRKRMEAEIQHANERFELIGKAANDAMWEFDIEKNTMWANLTHQELYGFTLADSVPDEEEWKHRLHPAEIEQVVKSVGDAKESDTNIWAAEYRFDAGERGWLNIYARTYIERDQHGKVKRMIGSMMDITQRKSEEAHLKLLESVITNTKDAVLITEAAPFAEAERKIVFVNKAFTEMTGYSAEEVIGKTPRILQGPKTDRAELDRLRESLDRWQSGEITVINYKKNGEEYWSNFSTSPVADKNGFYTNWISIQRDVTQSKLSEIKLIELNESLERHAKELAVSNLELEYFAYVASHDLQEPLRMVKSFMHLLEKKYADTLDETAKKYIHFAVDGSERMEQLIGDLLEYARAGSSSAEEKVKAIDEIVEEIKKLHWLVIQEKNVSIELTGLSKIELNHTTTRQVLQNLIGNAIKYQSPGVQPIIVVNVADQTTHWLLSVSDNGIGISSENLQDVFTVFKRLNSNKDYAGTGIGLAICKKIVEGLGGKIWVESKPDFGSSFYFTLKK